MKPQFSPQADNPVGLDGIDFVEFASPEPERLHQLFLAFGFSRTLRHRAQAIDAYQQGDITFLLNRQQGSFAGRFSAAHGPCIASMGWRVGDPASAVASAVARGARLAQGDLDAPAVRGIGDSLIYLTQPGLARLGFVPHPEPIATAPKGFVAIDHLTNNVAQGELSRWSTFYKQIFGFREVRYFDIRGVKTGLTSYALASPCGRFCIPINEGTERRSQINEYLDEYRGPGIQHLAFLTEDILASLRALDGTGISTLDIDDAYYDEVFQRLPQVSEDHAELRRRNVLVDGDPAGYLLQIFTHNVVGPIFIEIIQRKNHLSFGEGNFGALFRSIERDQERRGVL